MADEQGAEQAAMLLALPNAEATQRLGAALAELPAGSTLLLKGDLGSGKTTLAQGLGRQLGISEPIASPTFSLLNEYTDGTLPLYHFDLYRLDPDQVAALAPEQYWDGIEAPAGITLIEWCDRLPYHPETALNLTLEAIAPDPTLAGDSESDQAELGRVATLTLTGSSEVSLEAIAIAFERHGH